MRAARGRVGRRASRRRGASARGAPAAPAAARASGALGVGVRGEVLVAQQLHRRSTPPGTARASVGRGGASPSPGHGDARQHQRAPTSSSAGGALGRRRRPRRSTLGEGGVERGEVRRGASTAPRAARGRPRARSSRVDGAPAPGGRRSSSPTPDPHAAPARIAAGQQRRAGRVDADAEPLRHPRAPPLAHALDVLAHLQRDAERRLQVGVVVEREQRARPGDRLADARQLVELLARAAARPPRTRARRSPRARRAAARARSRPRARASGSRSSGRGSGA